MVSAKWLRLARELEEVGLTEAKIDAALKDNPAVRVAVIAKTQEVAAYWKAISPVSNAKPHPLYKDSGVIVDSPEEYRRAVKFKFKDGDGGLTGIVFNDSPVVRFVEYGTKFAKPQGIAQRVLDAFGGHNGAVEA
ncbi:hypothetical protein [Mycobacterium scrofulaceum]|uniref:Uncharacterized protein n=1 Tax=Mycobacterium scrofulaceum TaxID=1783 RepID=A0A1X0K6V4_MYCSC|nr:hypothetical protein [Mycobacterium scrofulaceum]ORB70856.1 hypothetical protein BST44_22770 [Mycobacterium scrofulaceum]